MNRHAILKYMRYEDEGETLDEVRGRIKTVYIHRSYQTLSCCVLTRAKSTISLFVGNVQGESSIGLTLLADRASNILTHVAGCTCFDTQLERFVTV